MTHDQSYPEHAELRHDLGKDIHDAYEVWRKKIKGDASLEGANAANGFIAGYHAALSQSGRVAQTEKVPERLAPVQGYSAGIPWSMHLRAYDAYCARYSRQRALIEGGCRGGFGVGELDMFIPGWREELSEITALKAEIARLTSALTSTDGATP